MGCERTVLSARETMQRKHNRMARVYVPRATRKGTVLPDLVIYVLGQAEFPAGATRGGATVFVRLAVEALGKAVPLSD